MDGAEINLSDAGGTFGSGINGGATMEVPDNDPIYLAMTKTAGDQPKTETPAPEVQPSGTEPEAKPDAATGDIKLPDGIVAEPKVDKVPYTVEELKALLADPSATLDTSRLDENGQAVHKEFQRGYTKKFEELKREREEIEKSRKQIAEFEARQKQLAEEQRYQKEVEELGEEDANRQRRDREMLSRIEALEYEKRSFQQREASEMFRRSYNEIAPKYQLPITDEFQDMVMSRVWATNELHKMNGQPLISMEDGVRMVADQIGFTNAANLEKIISANPKNKEAYDQKVISDYLKKKAVGATVPSSTQSNVSESSSDKSEKFSAEEYSKNPTAYLQARVERAIAEKLKQT